MSLSPFFLLSFCFLWLGANAATLRGSTANANTTTSIRGLQELVPDQSRAFQHQPSTGSPCQGEASTIQIAIAYDSSFCQALGGAIKAEQAIQTAVKEASLLFASSPLCTKLQISHLEGYCSSRADPYSHMVLASPNVCPEDGPDQGSLLNRFQKYWNTHRRHVPRDVAHLFHAHDFSSRLQGCAYQSTLCTPSQSYGVNQYRKNKKKGASLSHLFAHELGHNAGATHVFDKSLMNPKLCKNCNQFNDATVASILNHYSGVGCLRIGEGRGGVGGVPSAVQSSSSCAARRDPCSASTPCCNRWACFRGVCL